MIAALQKLSRLLSTHDAQPEAARNVRLAIAVLLLEVAKRDGDFSATEKTAIERLLAERFQLADSDREALFTAASSESADLVQLHPYTSAIASQLQLEARIALIEMLWEVAYSDGVLDPQEDALIRRLGNLLHVEDRDRVLARIRVLNRSGRTQELS